MPTAYVLLNTEIGAGTEVVKALKKVEGVESAFNLWGVYDVIASVKADSMDILIGHHKQENRENRQGTLKTDDDNLGNRHAHR